MAYRSSLTSLKKERSPDPTYQGEFGKDVAPQTPNVGPPENGKFPFLSLVVKCTQLYRDYFINHEIRIPIKIIKQPGFKQEIPI